MCEEGWNETCLYLFYREYILIIFSLLFFYMGETKGEHVRSGYTGEEGLE